MMNKNNSLSTTLDIKKYAPILLGGFILVTTLIFIILGGGGFFYDILPGSSREELKKVFGGGFYLIYFTIQTNLFLGIMLIFYFFKKDSIFVNSLLVSSVSLITITFIIYWTAIAPFNTKDKWTNVYLMFDNIVTHVLNPFIGFMFLIVKRKEFIVNKKYIGWSSLYISIYVIINIILYASSIHIDQNGKYENGIRGATVYSFLDVQHVLFTNLEKHPFIAWIINILLIILIPFLPITINYLWLKTTKIKTTTNSYFVWMEKFKNKFKIFQKNDL